MQSRWYTAARTGHNVISGRWQTTRPRSTLSAWRSYYLCNPAKASMMSSDARPPQPAAIAFGSNLGDRVGYIEAALREMRQAGLTVSRISPIYETKPMYYENQDLFLNGVCEVETRMQPLQLLDVLQGIETKLDRKREIQKGPRTIDLDILLFSESTFSDPRLEIPHKLLHEREFVLRPLNDIMPDTNVHLATGLKRKVSDLYRDLGQRDQSMSSVTELSNHLPLIRATDPSRRTNIMAILNLTPDSFSDGGVHDFNDITAIQKKVSEFVAAGASTIDIGGQSTRPNAELLSPEVELKRILPVIHAIRSMPALKDVVISIDTFYAQVAREAIAAGADIINDISAGVLDPGMLPTVAELGKTIVLMHMRGTPQTMNTLATYPNGVINEVRKELSQRVSAAEAAGIPRWRIILDPGIGFAKKQHHNLELLRRLSDLRESTEHANLRGLPWLVGVSRKSFVGKVTGVQEADKRLMGTAASVTASVAGGSDIVRVHDVKEMSEAVKMADGIYRVPLDPGKRIQ